MPGRCAHTGGGSDPGKFKGASEGKDGSAASAFCVAGTGSRIVSEAIAAFDSALMSARSSIPIDLNSAASGR